jgi:hypothetical protein
MQTRTSLFRCQITPALWCDEAGDERKSFMVNSPDFHGIAPLSIETALHFITVMAINPLAEHLCDQSIAL